MIADYPDAPTRLAPFLAQWDHVQNIEHASEIWLVRDVYAVSGADPR